MGTNSITVGSVIYELDNKAIPHTELYYFIDNPRVYSLFDRSKSNPTQDEMEQQLFECDDVRELKDSIEKNGGLIDPIIVRPNDMVVVEGNRRLAAYRMLSRKNPDKWKMISVNILPDDMPDSAIFSYIGHIHINGKKEWAPYEQAGYLYRTMKEYKSNPKEIANSIGLKPSSVKKMINIYEFMVKHDDQEAKHWSYYEQYLTLKPIKDVRNNVPELDEKIVIDIKAGKIDDARKSFREVLSPICRDRNAHTLIDDYINNRKTLDECISEVDSDALDTHEVLSKFKAKLFDSDFRGSIQGASKDDKERFEYELGAIKTAIAEIIKTLK